MSVSKWFWSLLLLCIPVVGFILLLIWAFGGSGDERKNFARAALLMWAVGIVLSIFFGVFSAIMGIMMFAP